MLLTLSNLLKKKEKDGDLHVLAVHLTTSKVIAFAFKNEEDADHLKEQIEPKKKGKGSDETGSAETGSAESGDKTKKPDPKGKKPDPKKGGTGSPKTDPKKPDPKAKGKTDPKGSGKKGSDDSGSDESGDADSGDKTKKPDPKGKTDPKKPDPKGKTDGKTPDTKKGGSGSVKTDPKKPDPKGKKALILTQTLLNLERRKLILKEKLTLKSLIQKERLK